MRFLSAAIQTKSGLIDDGDAVDLVVVVVLSLVEAALVVMMFFKVPETWSSLVISSEAISVWDGQHIVDLRFLTPVPSITFDSLIILPSAVVCPSVLFSQLNFVRHESCVHFRATRKLCFTIQYYFTPVNPLLTNLHIF